MAEEKRVPVQSGIDHLSASQISLYLNCPLKYRFQYIDQLPKPFKPSGLAFGSVIHSALEWFHKEKLLKVFEVDWFSQGVETDIRYKNGETDSGLRMTGRELLTQYFHWDQGKPVRAEVPFSLPLVEPVTGEVLDLRLEGIIDLIETDHVVVEFKTSARTMSSQELEDNLQLTCYAYAYEMLFQSRPQTLKVVNLVKAKAPKIALLETKRGLNDYQRFFHLAREVQRGVESGIFFPRASFMCKDCEYAGPCQEWPGKLK